MGAFHQKVEQAVILNTHLPQLRLQGCAFEEHPVVLQNLALFSGDFIVRRQITNIDSRL